MDAHPAPEAPPIDQAGAGYGHTQAGIVTAKGELVAFSRQTVTVFG